MDYSNMITSINDEMKKKKQKEKNGKIARKSTPQ